MPATRHATRASVAIGHKSMDLKKSSAPYTSKFPKQSPRACSICRRAAGPMSTPRSCDCARVQALQRRILDLEIEIKKQESQVRDHSVALVERWLSAIEPQAPVVPDEGVSLETILTWHGAPLATTKYPAVSFNGSIPSSCFPSPTLSGSTCGMAWTPGNMQVCTQ
ncbi:hypothetical protein BOTBODRAFT_519103 [Botryobasidium botryosum FD-172 SS1]|uniref:Uncharacterized protein n=1 Tax=Botryobasidium botryosum (strain FD-172 SS1) TaxID=930990 RepID=A0A067N3J3_BOTB1|nr:hypothetical protein BOTBODRAFT_519103 [Botryobasidium botryosum FD-172 SS1]